MSLDEQMVDLLERFEKTGEQFMLARCVELFREGLGSGFNEPDIAEAQAKTADKKQAFRSLEAALGQYADALRRMEAAKQQYESEAAEYKQNLSTLDVQKSLKSPEEIQRELEAKLKTLSDLEAQRTRLQQTLAAEQSNCHQLQQEVDELKQKKEVAAQKAPSSEAHKATANALQQTQNAVARVKELIAATEYLSDFSVNMDGLAHSISGEAERLQIQTPKIHFVLAFKTGSGKLTEVEVTYGQQHIALGVLEAIRDDAKHLDPPNDLRFALTMLRAASEARDHVQAHIAKLTDGHLVHERNGDVVVSFRNGVVAHLRTHFAYPTVPAGVYITHMSGIGFADEDLNLLASQINTAAYRTLLDAVTHIENACK